MGMWGDAPAKEEESSEEESSEEESEEEQQNTQEMTREERRAAAKAKKEAAIKKKKGVPQVGDMPSSSEEESDSEDDMPANPNHSKAARNQAAAPPRSVDEVAEGLKNMKVMPKKPQEMSRKEKEALAAQQARERYQKLHLEGKTDEAKADMARLKEIRAKREAEAARKQVRLSRIDAEVELSLTIILRPRRRSARSRRRPTRHRLRLARPSCAKPLLVHKPRRRGPRSKHASAKDRACIPSLDAELLDMLVCCPTGITNCCIDALGARRHRYDEIASNEILVNKENGVFWICDHAQHAFRNLD